MSKSNTTMNKKQTYKEINQLILTSKSIVITAHDNPDGDAMGSALSLFNLFSQLKINATVVVPNDMPDFLHWMPGFSSVVHYHSQKNIAKKIVANADLIFCVDFNALERLGNLKGAVEKSVAKKILIDHHPNPSDFAHYTFSDKSVSSASELVYEFINNVGFTSSINKDVAECIFVGIMTDTGSFSFNSSSPRTYEIISKLLKHGINKDAIFEKVYNGFSEDKLRLLGYCLSQKMEIIHEHNTGIISLTMNERKKYNYVPGDIEGLVNYPLSIKGIIFSVFFFEKNDHVKISLRSKGDFSANDFASKYFIGGGHKNAAGGKHFDNLPNTIAYFKKSLSEYNKIEFKR